MSETDSMNESAIQGLLKKATQMWWRAEAAIERIEQQVKSVMATTESVRDPAPVIHRRDRSPSESIEYNSAPVQRATFHESGGKTLAIIALVMSCVAFGAVAMYVILEAQLIDAKITAGAAQAEATAREARTTALVTKDKLEELREHLNSKGMNIPKLDGH